MGKLDFKVKSANPTAAILRLEEVRETILAQPDRFVMEVFYRDPRVTHDYDEVPDIDIFDEGCGTACCIAGWAIALEARRCSMTPLGYVTPRVGAEGLSSLAAEIIGIEPQVSDELFFADNWPGELERAHFDGDPTKRAVAGAAVIDLWIEALRRDSEKGNPDGME